MNTCKITKGRNMCGKGCSEIINALEGLERQEDTCQDSDSTRDRAAKGTESLNSGMESR